MTTVKVVVLMVIAIGLAGCTTTTPTPRVAVTVTATPALTPTAAAIGVGPGTPVDGPMANITSAGSCTLSEQGDPSVGNRYYTVHTTLAVAAAGEITINTADIEVLGSGSEIGSLQVAPVGSTPAISEPLVVTSGIVPFTGVADQNALSGQFGPSCKVVSVWYDDGNTAP